MTPCTCNTEMGDTCPKCAPQPVAPTTVDPRDAELTSLRAALEAQTLANGVLRGRVAEVEGNALALRSPLLSLLGEPSDSDLTFHGIVDHLRTRIVGAETHIAMHPGRYDNRLLDHALALLDLAAEKNETLQHIAAILRVGAGRP